MTLKIDFETYCLLTYCVYSKTKEFPQDDELNNLLEYLFELGSEKFEDDKK